MRRWQHGAIATITAAMLLPLYVPQALAFPYHRQVGDATVWSESPIPAAIDGVVAHADALVVASPLAVVPSGRHIFLTDGGWRWRWLSATASRAFALTRPLSEAVVVNHNDVAADRVTNGAAVGGSRTLSGVLAHERTHTLIRARYGEIAAATLPLWLREGYPDYVANESSLSPADADELRRQGEHPPALAYYEGRRRVARELAAGRTVDSLFTAGSR